MDGNEDEREARPARALKFSEKEYDAALVLPQHAKRADEILDYRNAENAENVGPTHGVLFGDRPDYEIIVLELSVEDAKKRLALRGRYDEATEEQIRNRFRWYAENTVPAIEILEKNGRKAYHIDASLSIEQVHMLTLRMLSLDV